MTSFARVRGRTKSAVVIAWLARADEVECSTEDASFDLVTDNGVVRVRVDRSTEWKHRRRSYSGPWKDLEEEMGPHPFVRPEIEGEAIVDYAAIDFDEGAPLEVWGVPRLGVGEGAYRESRGGVLEEVTATFVALQLEPEPAKRSLFFVVLLVGAIGLAGVAPFTGGPFALLRCALVVAIFALRGLHDEARAFGPRTADTSLAFEVVRVPLWAYVGLGFAMPVDVPWIRIMCALILAFFTVRWARRENRMEVYDALLGPKILEGIVQSGSVRTESIALAASECSITWLEDGHYEGPHAIMAPRGDGWILVRSRHPMPIEVFRRARRWDRTMPAVYLAIGFAALALAWPRF